MKTTFAEILSGCEPGRVQTVAQMQMIPLVASPGLDDGRFVSPAQAHAVVSTTNYGSLKIQNPSASVLLVPPHAAYMTKKAAQDHALPAGAMLAGEESRTFDTAICIEETQGGYMPPGAHEMHLLPLGLRERAWDRRDQRGYNRLWGDIRSFNQGFGITGHAHISYFFDRFEDELDVFVAEFEPVPRQVGAIFLIAGRLAGLERSPSASFFTSIWRPLVRDCYGSHAMVARREREGPPGTRVALRPGAATLGELAQHLAEATSKERELVRSVVDPILAEEVEMSLDHSLDLQGEDTQLLSLETSSFAGQVIQTAAGRVIFASLVASDVRRAAGADQAAKSAEPFRF